MKTESELNQAELNEIFRLAGESAITAKQDQEMARIVEAIKAAPEVAKHAVETVGIAGYRRHLETKGFRCSTDRLRRGLIQAGMWRSRRHKSKPGIAQ